MNNNSKFTQEDAIKNIETIVQSIGFNKSNYVYIDNKFITQQVLAYNNDKIITFFVKKNKDYSLKKFCFSLKNISFRNSILDLWIKRIIKEEYNIEMIEDIAYIEDENELYFIDDYGAHYFKISTIDIYGFNQEKQINRLKEYVNKINIENRS